MSNATVNIYLNERIARINKNIYGHFAEHLGRCIYEGVWVGEDSPIPNTRGIRNDVVAALRKIKPPVIRWPGGCFADDYHWRDGIGPRDQRPRTVNTHWGQVIETNEFGTHEFIDFCRMVGAEPYICGNVGSGTPKEMRDWVEYCNFAGDSTLARERARNGSPEPFGVRYWGVGNENWGCGGNFCPEDYAAEFKRFRTFLFDFQGTRLFLIACGPPGNNVDWTRRFFDKLRGNHNRLHGYAAHYYCGTAGTATEYNETQWYELLTRATKMEELIVQQRAIMDGYDPQRRIGLIVDEWGTWHPPTPGENPSFLWQQNTLRDALVAALSLDIMNRHADKIVMSNIAQTINVLQAMILTQEEKMLVTPTYHVYDMYSPHQDADAVFASFEADAITFKEGRDGEIFGLDGSVSLRDGKLFITAVNPHVDQPVEAKIRLYGGRAKSGSVRVLSDSDIHAHNTFDNPNAVEPKSGTVTFDGDEITYLFEPASVTAISVDLG